MAWGMLWWFGTGLEEIDRRLDRRHELVCAMTFISLSATAMGILFRRVDWKGLRWPALGFLPVMVLASAALFDQYTFRHPFQDWWVLAWPAAFAVHYFLLRTMEATWNQKISAGWHVAGALWATALLGREAGWLLDQLAGGGRVWAFIGWGGVPAVVVVALIRLRRLPGWPFDAWHNAYRGWLPTLLVSGLMAWTLLGLALNGDPGPLPYIPLLNPLDLMQIFVFLVILSWVLWMNQEPLAPAEGLPPAVLWGVPAAGIFLWLTAVVARTVHHLGNVRYDGDALFRSDLFHAAIAVLWGLLALGLMIAANRLKRRAVWFTGTGLLTVVVIKLFMVDLSGSGTVSRIVSFLAVGGLMLVIGFFTPLASGGIERRNPMRKWLWLLLLVLCNPSVSLAELTVDDFAYGIKIDVPAGTAVAAMSLPEQVYASAFRRDLGDIRVFNAGGEPVPHMIRYAQTQSAEAPWRSLAFFPLPEEVAPEAGGYRVFVRTGPDGAVVQVDPRPATEPDEYAPVVSD